MEKVFWRSRLLWVNGMVALAPCLPFVHAWILRDPIHVMQFHALYCFILRLDTSGKIVAKQSALKEES